MTSGLHLFPTAWWPRKGAGGLFLLLLLPLVLLLLLQSLLLLLLLLLLSAGPLAGPPGCGEQVQATGHCNPQVLKLTVLVDG